MDGPLCPPISPVPVQCTPYSTSSPIFKCSYVLTLNFLLPTKMLHFLSSKLTKSFVSPLNDKFPPQNGSATGGSIENDSWSRRATTEGTLRRIRNKHFSSIALATRQRFPGTMTSDRIIISSLQV